MHSGLSQGYLCVSVLTRQEFENSIQIFIYYTKRTSVLPENVNVVLLAPGTSVKSESNNEHGLTRVGGPQNFYTMGPLMESLFPY